MDRNFLGQGQGQVHVYHYVIYSTVDSEMTISLLKYFPLILRILQGYFLFFVRNDIALSKYIFKNHLFACKCFGQISVMDLHLKIYVAPPPRVC